MGKTNLAIFGFFFFIYTLTWSGILITDNLVHFDVARNLALHGRTSLSCPSPGLHRVGKDGRAYSKFGLGQPVASVPLFVLGKIVTDALDSNKDETVTMAGETIPVYTAVQAAFTSFLNPIVTALTCAIFFSLCHHIGYGSRTALLLTLALGLATMMWVYSKRFWPHPLITLLLVGTVHALYRYKVSSIFWYLPLAGTLTGFAVFTRLEHIIIVPWLCLYVAILNQKPERRGVIELLRRESLFVGPVFAFLALMSVLNYLHFGHWFGSGYGGEALAFRTPLLTGLRGNLFSVGRSIFLFSAPLLLFFFVIGRFYRKHRWEASLILLVSISYLTLYSKWWAWSGGICWGPRFLLPIIPLLMLPVGLIMEKVKCRRLVKWGLIMVAAAGVVVQVLGVSVPLFNQTYEKAFATSFSDAMYFRHSQIPMHARELLLGHLDLWFTKGGYHTLGGVCLVASAVLCLILLIKLTKLEARRA